MAALIVYDQASRAEMLKEEDLHLPPGALNVSLFALSKNRVLFNANQEHSSTAPEIASSLSLPIRSYMSTVAPSAPLAGDHVLPPAEEKYPIQTLFRRRDSPSPSAYVLSVFKNSDYMLGAMACAYSLKKTGTEQDVVCMVTEDIPDHTIDLAKGVFDVIVRVTYLSGYTIPLRTEKQRAMYEAWTNIAFTKWNCLGLAEYKKVMFVDADKIVLQNVDLLFSLPTPAGTFSSAQAQGYAKKGGMPNPYLRLRQGDVVGRHAIEEGLRGTRKGDSFVVIGTMVVLAPSREQYEEFIRMLGSFTKDHPFGFPHCNSMMDEQAIVHFYQTYLPKATGKVHHWTYVSQKYNWVLWNPNWLRPYELPPAVVHYFNVKPWYLKRYDWLDLEVYWGVVECMLKDNVFDQKQVHALTILYRPDQLAFPAQKGCFYCKLYGRRWDHQFYSNCKVVCPIYAEQLAKN